MSSAGIAPDGGAHIPDDRFARLERQVSELSGRLSRLEGALEEMGAVARREEIPVPVSFPKPARAEGAAPAAFLALAGRSLLVLGGAYVIRAVTESAWDPLESTCRHASLSIL